MLVYVGEYGWEEAHVFQAYVHVCGVLGVCDCSRAHATAAGIHTASLAYQVTYYGVSEIIPDALLLFCFRTLFSRAKQVLDQVQAPLGSSRVSYNVGGAEGAHPRGGLHSSATSPLAKGMGSAPAYRAIGQDG